MASDEELVGDVADGSEPALEELLGRYERPLKTFLLRNGAGADVDDAFQEVWIRVVKGAPGFDRSRRFSSWMFTIAVNCCRDQFARRSRMERPVEAVGEDSHAAPSADRVDAERLLGRLEPREREVLVLRYYNDMSEADMSEILAVPRGTIKSRLHSAVSKLARLVKTDDAEEK
jgi:RNA polymerase sigma-70 factor (ECF subfamily)